MTSTMLLRTSLSRTNIEWHDWCHQTTRAQWSRQAAILVNKPRTESGTSQMGNNIFALCIRAGNWGWWRLFMWHNLDRARTNIPQGSYGESGWLGACCNRVCGVVSHTEPPSHPSLTISHRFAPTWTNPPEHLSKKWGWQGHTGILSNSNVFNTTAGTSANVHTVTPAMTLYTHTTPLKSVFYLSDCMMLLLALTTTAAFINLAGIIATLQGSPKIQKTLLIHHQRSYEAPSCTQPPLC